MPSRGMSARQTAHLLGVRLDEVYGLLWAGKLKGQKLDGRWVISEVDARKRASRGGSKAVGTMRTK